jgi:hypothetical protein
MIRHARRHRLTRLASALLLAASLLPAVPLPSAHAEHHGRDYDDRAYDDRDYGERDHGRHRGGYNSDYIFAATRAVNDMDAPEGLKITLIPVTLIVDLAFLPFATIAGLFG